MSMLRLYGRVLGLLGPQASLGIVLAASNVALAAAQLAEPVLRRRICASAILTRAKGPQGACERAQALDFIERHDGGLDAIVGERGRSLSGGERQSLSIARALLKDPPILILDEATSALDAGTEAKVTAALNEVMQGRTTFVIAHRLATVRNADRILVFDEGRIVESGSFEELMRAAARSPRWPRRIIAA